MKITLPERLAGTRDALFVLEVEFPVATEERTVEVQTEGAIEALDLRGTGPGGSYAVPVGLERLHVPMRVTADSEGEAQVRVACTAGPDSGATEARTILLEQGPAAAASSGAGGKVAIAAILIAVLGIAAWKFLPGVGSGPTVPTVAGLSESEAVAALQKADYRADVVTQGVAEQDQHGVVLRTIPAAGAKTEKGSKVQVVVGHMQEQVVRVDSVVGQVEAAAAAALKAAGFQSVTQFQDAGPGDVPGRVLRQSPAGGARIARGATVEIFVAREPAVVPGTTPGTEPGTTPGTEPGTTPGTEPGTTPGTEPGTTPGTEPGTTPGTEPGTTPGTEPGTTPGTEPGTTPAAGQVILPQVTGMTLEAAEKALEELGLLAIPETKRVNDPTQDGKVVAQFPEFKAGKAETVSAGGQVYLTVARYQKPIEPDPMPGTEPGTTPGTEPGTTPGTEPGTTTPGTEPGTTPGTEPGTTPGTEPGTTPGTEPGTTPGTEPGTTPGTEPGTTPGTEPGTTPGTEPGTTPGTEPGTTPGTEPGTPTVRVPDLIALSRARATGLVRQAGLRSNIDFEETADVPDGQVVSQRPEAGESLQRGGTVLLVVARAPSAAGIVVPDVVGRSREDAERALREESFLVRTTYSGGPLNDVGKVRSQNPAGGASADRRTWVEIVVVGGSGPERGAIGGEPEAPLAPTGDERPAVPAGTEDLENAPTRGEGPVRRPAPTAAGATARRPVELPAPDSPPTQTVPSMTGMDAKAAIRAALEAGLVPILEIDRSASGAEGVVSRQAPAPGAKALAGALVRLGVRMGPRSAERYVSLPTALGGRLARERAALQSTGARVRVIEIAVPGHPYAGTGLVAGQWPVSSVPLSVAREVTLWVVK